MKELSQEAHRLSKSLGALGARLNVRAVPTRQPVYSGADEDLFKAVESVRTPSSGSVSVGTEDTQGAGTVNAQPPSINSAEGRVADPAATANAAANATSKPSMTPSRPENSYSIKRDTMMTLQKYSPDQPRDSHGRWSVGGVLRTGAALLGGAALIGGGLLLARNPALLRRTFGGNWGRNMSAVAGKPRPMARPAAGGTSVAAAAKPVLKPRTRATKPFAELSARQQQRRAAAARAAAIERGATPAQADAMVNQMRTQTGVAAASKPRVTGSSIQRASITTPMAMRVEQERLVADVARHSSMLKEYESLADKGFKITNAEASRRTYLYNSLNALATEIGRREKALGIKGTARTRIVRPKK